jgi:hypothetical protein
MVVSAVLSLQSKTGANVELWPGTPIILHEESAIELQQAREWVLHTCSNANAHEIGRQHLSDQHAGSVARVCSKSDADCNLWHVLLQPRVQQGRSRYTAKQESNNTKEQREVRQEPL